MKQKDLDWSTAGFTVSSLVAMGILVHSLMWNRPAHARVPLSPQPGIGSDAAPVTEEGPEEPVQKPRRSAPGLLLVA